MTPVRTSRSIHDERNFQNIDDLFTRITLDHRYVLAIAIKGNYFEN